MYAQLIFNKDAKAIQWGKEVSLTNIFGKTGNPSAKEWK